MTRKPRKAKSPPAKRRADSHSQNIGAWEAVVAMYRAYAVPGPLSSKSISDQLRAVNWRRNLPRQT